MSNLTRLSKFLAVLLRHEPEKFGLTLDEAGFTEIDAVWLQIQKRYGEQYSYNDLLKVVDGDSDSKKRYEIDGKRIRALYGHSDVRPISYPTAEPPEFLYHGTTQEALASILKEGLKARSRQQVHLTTNLKLAQQVGQRHRGKTVILKIRAGDAYRAGITFYHPEAEHYLVEAVPPEFIESSKS